MTVVRVKQPSGFTIISNSVLENPNLSFKAKGLWAYCMSKPDNWNFHVSHLATVSQEGKNAVYSALKELEKEGIVEKVQENTRGKFGPVDYVIYPYSKEIQIILPLRDFPQTEKPHAENPPLVSTDNIPKTDLKKKPPPPSSKSKDLWENLRDEFEEEEISFARKRYEERPKNLPPIKCPRLWIKTLLANRDDLPDYMGILIKKHKNKAMEWEKSGQKHRGDRVTASKDYVEFTDGPHHKMVNYAVSDEEWQEKTGWK